MAIRLIRQDSETPNVTNHDDARMVRYAYGGYDGFVKDRGSEIGYAIDGTSFIVQSGVLVLQGWEVEIDANGAAVSIPAVSTKLYFSVYLEVNCGTDSAAIKSTYNPGIYPDIPASDDLTANTVGTARLLLYQFIATNGVISDVNKVVQGIEYSQDSIDALQNNLLEGTIIPANAKSVNTLEIKRDENGVLKIGDTIIPQKKLIWSGEVEWDSTSATDITITLDEAIESNEKIEICCYHKGSASKNEISEIYISRGEGVLFKFASMTCVLGTFLFQCWIIQTNNNGKNLVLGKKYNLMITNSGNIETGPTSVPLVLTKVYKIIE